MADWKPGSHLTMGWLCFEESLDAWRLGREPAAVN